MASVMSAQRTSALVLAVIACVAKAIAAELYFDVPRQRADLALMAFAQQADLSVLFPFDEVSKETANGLIGSYEIEEAIAILLDGTGLTAVLERERQLVVHVSLSPPEEGENGRDAGLGILSSGSGSAAQEEDRSRLAEIMVTARYVAEDLQDTPLAITVVTGQELELRSLTNVEDIGYVVPNAYIRPGAAVVGPTPTIGIRGASHGDYNYAFEPAVGVYIDDVYYGTLLGSAMELLDLERAEVLRGPQGTLFGKNTLGGALRLFSRVPQGDNTGYAEATFGSYNRADLKAMFDVELVPDKLFMRVSGLSKQVDGYMDLLDFTCQMNANGTPELAGTFPTSDPSASQRGCEVDTLGAEETLASRAMIRFLANDDLEFNFSLDYTDDQQESAPNTLILPAPANTGVVANLNEQYFATYGIRYDERFIPADPFDAYATFDDPVLGISYTSTSSVESSGFSGSVDWGATDEIQGKLIVAYRQYDAWYSHDPDLSPLVFANSWGVLDHEATSVELRFSGLALNNRLNWTTGAYYFDAESHIGGAVDYVASHWTINDRIGDSNESVFAHAVYELTERASLNLGARYSRNEKIFAFDHPGLLSVPDPAVSSDDRTDWKLAIDYQLTEDMMLYASAATGFRPPGVSPRPVTVNQLTPFDAEELTAYEIGLKNEFLDHRLRLNLAAFYSDYSERLTSVGAFECLGEDDPVPTFDPSTCPGESSIWYIYTTSPATVKGLELEADAELVGGVSISASLGWNDFDTGITDPNARGYRHPDNLVQPEWNVSAGFQYEAILASGGRLTARLDWFYQDDLFAGRNVSLPPDPLYSVDDYSVVNGRLTFDSANEDWSASLAVTNLTDEFYYYNKFGGSGFSVNGQPGRPREWAVSVRRNF